MKMIGRPQGKGMLVLAALAFLGMAFALTNEELWPAAACALSAIWALDAYRRDRQAEAMTKQSGPRAKA